MRRLPALRFVRAIRPNSRGGRPKPLTIEPAATNGLVRVLMASWLDASSRPSWFSTVCESPSNTSPLAPGPSSGDLWGCLYLLSRRLEARIENDMGVMAWLMGEEMYLAAHAARRCTETHLARSRRKTRGHRSEQWLVQDETISRRESTISTEQPSS